MFPIALLLAAVLALRMAWLVLASAAHRRDARGLAAVCLADGLTEIYFAARVHAGYPFEQALGVGVGLVSAMVTGYAAVEFTHAFPDDRPAPWRLRVGLGTLGVLAAVVWRATGREGLIYVYLLTCTAIMLSLLIARLRRLRGTRDAVSVAMILLAVSLRFVAGFAVAYRHRLEHLVPGITPVLITARRTFVPITADMLASIALLRSQFVGARSVAGKLGLSLGVALGTLALTALGVDAALRYAAGPGPLRVQLVAVAAIPAVVLLVWKRFGARVEAALLAPLDPARAARREALEEVAHAAAQPIARTEVVAIACAAVERLTGASVRFLAGPGRQDREAAPDAAPRLPAALAARLSALRARHVTRGQLHEASETSGETLAMRSADLLVPVRHAEALYGALALVNGAPERPALETAAAIADQLAMRLDHEALFEERIRIHAELQTAQRLAALGAFAAAIAHDIRTPLTSVQMNVQLLRGKVRLPADDMEHFEIALAELARLDTTAGAILEYAKPVKLCAVTVDLDELVDDVLRALDAQLAERRLRVERHRDAPALVVPGDVQKLRRVLQNLLVNALEASPEGGAIRVRTRALDDARVALDVGNTGRAIRDEDLPHLFEPFYTTRAGGTGLGLAIVERLVRAHGGEVQVAASPEGGATFSVVLPAVSHDDTAQAAAS